MKLVRINLYILTGVFVALLSLNVQAATYTATNTTNSGAGSLRQAVADANATTADDQIAFSIMAGDPGCDANGVCTITLTSGEISIASSAVGGALTILNSSGPGKLVISGNMSSRVLAVNLNSNFILDGVTITRGNNGGFSNSNGNATIQNSIFTQNTGTYAIVSINTGTNTLNVINCSIVGNAGGINGNNQVTAGGRLNIIRSTISGNTGTDGGGVRFDGDVANIVNSTISGNSSPNGGGLYAIRGSFNITNTTITNNNATGPLSPSGGGGVSIFMSGVFPRNTIIAGNISAAGTPDINFQNMAGVLNSTGNNLFGNITNTGQHPLGCGATNFCGQPARLAPLGNYGGLMQTHALLPDSLAINAGNNCVVTAGGCGAGDPSVAIPTDQRGFARIGNVDIGAFEHTSINAFDFDGDGKADIAVFRPATFAFWYVQASSAGFSGTYFGTVGDLIAPGDYDGDRKTDLSFYSPGNGSGPGAWNIRYSGGGQTFSFVGSFFDLPAPGDFDGDGKSDVALFNPFTGIWLIYRSTAGFQTVHFGQQDDVAVPADYDGDGKTDIAVYRPSTGAWYRIDSSNGQFHALLFGTNGDLPVPGDYDGDMKTDEAVFRPSSGVWYLNQSLQGFTGVLFGTLGDRPVAADYDADGKADIAVFRPSTGVWYLLRSTQGSFAMRFGQNGDIAVPAAFVP